MSRHHSVIERRDYALSPQFPAMVLAGDNWRISDKPSGVFHFHSCLEIGICQSDSATLAFPDAAFPITAGDVTVISSGMLHTTYSTPGCQSKWSYIFSDPDELLQSIAPQLFGSRLDLFRNFLRNYRVVIHPEKMPAIGPLVEAIIQEMLDQPPNYRIAVSGLFITLMSKLVTIPSKAVPGSGDSATVIPIAPALAYIEKNYAQRFQMLELADLCYMSQSHFRRLFTQIMGCGPLEYLNQTRIEHACSMLKLSQDSILSISEKSGFTSLSSFNRHFLAITGMTPTDWRRRMNADQQFTIQCYDGWLQPPEEES